MRCFSNYSMVAGTFCSLSLPIWMRKNFSMFFWVSPAIILTVAFLFCSISRLLARGCVLLKALSGRGIDFFPFLIELAAEDPCSPKLHVLPDAPVNTYYLRSFRGRNMLGGSISAKLYTEAKIISKKFARKYSILIFFFCLPFECLWIVHSRR